MLSVLLLKAVMVMVVILGHRLPAGLGDMVLLAGRMALLYGMSIVIVIVYH